MPDVFELQEFSFKGSRTYVHGTDFFNAISTFFSKYDGYVKELAFRSFTRHQCRIHLHSFEAGADKIVCQGRWQSTLNHESVKFWVTESSNSVIGRYEFDEEALYEGATLKEAGVKRDLNGKFSVIENIVALTKHFHHAKLPVNSGKWVFGQISLNEPLPFHCRSVEIINHQNIKNRFSRNQIVLDGRAVGEIRFIVS